MPFRHEVDRDRAHRRWTKPEEADLVREARRGLPLHEIAKRHKRTEAAIEARAIKLKVGPIARRRVASGATGTTPPPEPRRSLLGRLFRR